MSVAQVILDLEKTKEIAEALLLSKIVLCQSLKGGRNSRVYKFECANGKSFIGKFYYQDKNDSRNRLGVEYSSLQFLWQKGIRSIPQPLFNDFQNHCAIYQYVEGHNFSGQAITQADMDQALGLVIDLQNIQRDISASQFSGASEACFSIEEILSNIKYRRERLDGVDHAELKNFLKSDFDPFWSELVQWCKQEVLKAGGSLQKAITLDQKTLSPSDFGFHNAIKRADGKIIFCDFEYFGWDDSAKMTSDFILHPAMHLSEELKMHFVRGMQKIFSDGDDFHLRLRLVYPFFGMKWCLIFLNEFLSQDFSRRLYADHKIDQENLLIEQLGKTKDMLTRIENTYRANPYVQ